MITIANKMISFYYAIKFQCVFVTKKFKLRQFLKQNPDFTLMFSSEADKRLKSYIKNTDVRLKKLAAGMMLKSYIETYRLVMSEELSIVELNYMSYLIPKIKEELKII